MKTIQLRIVAILCLGVHRSSLEILQRQKRDWIIDSLEINEGYNGSFPYSLGYIKLADEVRAFNLHGHGVELEPIGLLKINEETGEITVNYAADYEKYPVLKLTFEAMFKETKLVDTRLGVEVRIIDANDNPPTFEPQTVELTVLESTKQGTNLVSLLVSDRDSDTNNNNKFGVKMLSVTPKPQDVEFYLEQRGNIAIISFKGCLDYEIEGSVKENVDNALVQRVQAEDKDTRNTAAWRVNYQIHGDPDNKFQIETDPETNDGLLYVKKPLDHEASPLVNLTLTLDNEIPYYLCKVVKRTEGKLWQVTGSKAEATAQGMQSMSVTVTVEDVNEAPVFDELQKQAKMAENGKKGMHLARFTAKDPDIHQSNAFVFMKGTDEAGWITVDKKTGEVTTAKSLDRESPYVKDGIYNATVLVIDHGSPPMTGTATLTIHVSDENDNSPVLGVNTIDMCQSDEASVVNISVTDLDGDPYGGPFSYKVLGDVEGKWRVHPRHGYFVNLVKENTVFSGEYDLLLEVADRQHETSVHNLSVTVCACHNPAIPNCRQRSTSGSIASTALIGIILVGILLLAAALCAILVTCKRKITQFPEGTYCSLIGSNSESPGTDCKVTLGQSVKKSSENGETLHTINNNQAVSKWNHNASVMRENMAQLKSEERFLGASSALKTGHEEGHFLLGVQQFRRNEALDASSAFNVEHHSEYLQERRYQSWIREKNYSTACEANDIKAHRQFLLRLLNNKLQSLEAVGEELGDYESHAYADEAAAETLYELDAISLPEIPFDPNMDLDDRFQHLASIGMTHQSTKTTLVHKPVQVALENYHSLKQLQEINVNPEWGQLA
ncbi:desmocollin 2-like protein isoform X2 [Nelusetta ayraudi]|uniref:desmocollin 2-like protein isoform X2 n=1 Tax=Nelusetta ayraudi TaxID=303726 RepID=UPI003F7230C7